MTNNNSHRHCTHPATKAGRAKCRRERGKISAEFNAVMDLGKAAIALQTRWEWLSEHSPATLVDSASDNADLTAQEMGFNVHTMPWHEIAVSSLQMLLDTAELCRDPKDPEEGQRVELKNESGAFWVCKVWRREAGSAWATDMDVVDVKGNFRNITPDDIYV